MKPQELPQTDSISELARFWDTHDLTDFEDQFEEVTEPVFAPRHVIAVKLDSGEAHTLSQLAKASGIAESELIHRWVRQHLQAG